MERSRQHLKRKFWDTPMPLFNPWMRVLHPCRPQYGIHFEKANHFGKFDEFVEHNMYLDCKTKRAALVASPFVVCLTSYTGAQRLFICSGTVVHSYGVDGEYFSTILTSATLIRCPKKEDAIADDIKVDVRLFDRSLCEGEILGYDFHYNVAAIRIKSDVRLQTAVIGNLDDYTECLVRSGYSPPFQLVPHRDTTTSSELIKLCPGMAVIALGRYNDDPYHIMAAPDKLVLKDCGLDCGELVMVNSEITKNGIGGPLINYSGRVIGLNFYQAAYTPFLPINIALKCLEHLLKYREVPQPWLGLEISDLGTTGLGDLEKLIQSSPNTLSGVFVRKVESRSPASDAGISPDDIIIQIDGIHVESSLKFTSVLLDKAKEPFELVVKRAGSSTPLTLPVLPLNFRKLNRWPLPEEFDLCKPCLTMRSVP